MKINKQKKITHTYYITCPTCKEEIKGTTEVHAVANLRIHFQTKHPNKKWDKEIELNEN